MSVLLVSFAWYILFYFLQGEKEIPNAVYLTIIFISLQDIKTEITKCQHNHNKSQSADKGMDPL